MRIGTATGIVWGMALGLARSADASPPVWPELSYSMALGRTDTGAMVHFWIGAGVNVGERVPSSGRGIVLGGIEIDLRHGGNELWTMSRIGMGAFRDRALAPMAACYLFGGGRVAGPVDSPRVRLGGGCSIPAAMDPLARIGIPTMIEAGVDFHGYSRGFLRVGWNF